MYLVGWEPSLASRLPEFLYPVCEDRDSGSAGSNRLGCV